MSAFLWRVNPRTSRYTVTFQLSQRAAAQVTSFVIYEALFGVFGAQIVTSQEHQTIAAAGEVGPSVYAFQGSETIDATGNVSADAVVTTKQESQSIAAVNAVPSRPAFTVLQRINPRTWGLTAAYRMTNRTASAISGALALEEFFGTFTLVETQQASQTIAAAGSAQIDCVGTTAQGGQSIFAYKVFPQTINPDASFDTAAFGTATVYNFNQEITFTGDDYLTFGTPIAGSNRITPEGFDSAEFGSPNILINEVLGIGFDSLEFGTADIGFRVLHITPTGFDASAFGTATLRKNTIKPVWMIDSLVDPDTGDSLDAVDPAGYGTPTVSNYTRYVTPTGFTKLAFGTAFLRTNKLLPTGFSTMAFGTARVHTNKLTPTGFDKMAFGTARVSHNPQYVTPTGFEALRIESDETPPGEQARVRHATNPITMTGFDVSRLGRPTIGFPQGCC